MYILWFKLICFTEQWWGLKKMFESFVTLELYVSIFISILVISSENWTLLLHPKNKQTNNQKQKSPAIVLAAYSIKRCLVLWLQNLSQINWLIQKKARFSPIEKTDLGFGIILSFIQSLFVSSIDSFIGLPYLSINQSKRYIFFCLSNQIVHSAVKHPAKEDSSHAATAPLLELSSDNLPVYNKHSSVAEYSTLYHSNMVLYSKLVWSPTS